MKEVFDAKVSSAIGDLGVRLRGHALLFHFQKRRLWAETALLRNVVKACKDRQTLLTKVSCACPMRAKTSPY